MDYELKQNDILTPIVFLLIAEDHVTGLEGALGSLNVWLSKNGGAFNYAEGALSEIAHGWYAIAGHLDDRDTIGPLAIHAEATGADPYDGVVMVAAYTMADLMAQLTSSTESNVITVSPVRDGGVLELYAGDDYLESIGRQLQWEPILWISPPLPPMSELSVILRFMQSDIYAVSGIDTLADLEVDGTVTDVGGSAVFKAELTSQESATLTNYGNKTYVYQVIWTDQDQQTAVQIQGFATILRRAASSAVVIAQTIFRPSSNNTAQWKFPEYTRLDQAALYPALPEETTPGIIGGGPPQPDNGEILRLNVDSPDRDCTRLRVWIFAYKSSSSDFPQVSLTINGVTEPIQPFAAQAQWEVLDFVGTWTPADFAAEFTIDLTCPTLANLGTCTIYGLYVQVIDE